MRPRSAAVLSRAVLARVTLACAVLSGSLFSGSLPSLGAAPRARAEKPALPENLAPSARIEADSEYSDRYLARFVADGAIPGPGSQAADLGKAWCVKGDTHRDGATISFAWPEDVTVAEIVYHGRTSWFAEECWKGYGVLVGDATEPALEGSLERGHGPQRMILPAAARTRKVTIRFTSSHGGLNPGAAEIQIFPERVPEGALARFRPLPPGPPPTYLETEIEESPALARRIRDGSLGFDRLVAIHRREINPTHVYTQHVEGFSPGGGLCIVDLASTVDPGSIVHSGGTVDPGGIVDPGSRVEPEGTVDPGGGEARPRVIVPSPEGQILDCDVSHDGRRILFSWRRTPAEGYHLFTVEADGSGLTRLTDGPWHDYNACWLPDGGIAFLSTRSPQFAYCWVSPVGILFRMEADGSDQRPLSANYLNDFTPAVLDDGRIIYGRWEYVDRPAIPIQSLWTIRPDGTGLAVFYGNRVLSPATFIEPRAVPGTAKVICTLTAHNGPCRGGIGLVDPTLGVNSQEAIENLTPEVSIGRVDRGDGNNVQGPYENPYPIDGDLFLVSKRGTILARDYAGSMQTAILHPRDGMGFYSPMPLRARPRPPAISSQIATARHDGHPRREPGEGSDARSAGRAEAEGAGAGSAGGAGEAGEAGGAWATLILKDVYRGLEPAVRRGEVKALCIVEEMGKSVRTDVNRRAFGFQFPVISCGATYASKKVWGYVPVEEDGSAVFEVPADAPIYFMAIDDRGRAVQRMRSFTHLKPGEVQGCVGCHEPRSQTAPPVRPRALDRPPVRPAPPEWGGPEGFDYARVVQPVLDRRCVGCHSWPGAAGPATGPAGKVDLSGDRTDFFNVSYETLARGRQGGRDGWGSPYVSWIPTYNGMEANILEVTPRSWGSPRSRLADLIISGHPDAEGKPRVALDDSERLRILAWIDLNVPYYGTSETAHPDNEGCRRIVPADLDAVLAEVAARRCSGCHEGGKIPRKVWTRIENPHLNDFLMAPLARSAGGSGACGEAVFADREDPDYRAILGTFDAVRRLLAERPRMDMPGARPAEGVDRSCQ